MDMILECILAYCAGRSDLHSVLMLQKKEDVPLSSFNEVLNLKMFTFLYVNMLGAILCGSVIGAQFDCRFCFLSTGIM